MRKESSAVRGQDGERERIMRNRVGIIGGGAAGMTAAISAAAEGAEVTLIEGNDRLGKKILATGNGRCNLGNEKLDVGEYYTCSPERLEKCLERFKTEDTISFFHGMGLMLRSRNGYLYPLCEQASAVLDVLRHQVAALGIHVVTECRAEHVERDKKTGKLQVRGSAGVFLFDRVVIACGGCAAPKTGSDGSGFTLAKDLGHKLVPTVPALVQLRCREDYFKSVAGVRADAMLRVRHKGEWAAAERGELLLTDYGISGIPVFQLSRVVNYILLEDAVSRKERGAGGRGAGEVEICIDFLPDYTQEAFREFAEERRLLQGQRTVEEFFAGMLHKKLMLLFVRLAGLKPSESMAGADQNKIRQVYRFCRHWTVHVTGSNSYENAQVCAGGVPLHEVTEDLESKKMEGVYFAGEILDVDGKCGGYNLQWAWCSGHLAGRAAAKMKSKKREQN